MSKKASQLALTRKRNATKRLRERRKTAHGRLSTDGATSTKQIRLRALWLSTELGLPKCPKVEDTMTEDLADYCERHHVSFDWLIGGDLKGLQRMMQQRRTLKVGWGSK